MIQPNYRSESGTLFLALVGCATWSTTVEVILSTASETLFKEALPAVSHLCTATVPPPGHQDLHCQKCQSCRCPVPSLLHEMIQIQIKYKPNTNQIQIKTSTSKKIYYFFNVKNKIHSPQNKKVFKSYIPRNEKYR